MATPTDKPPTDELLVAVLLPPAGVIVAIVLFAKGRGAHGAAVLLASVVAYVVWMAVLEVLG